MTDFSPFQYISDLININQKHKIGYELKHDFIIKSNYTAFVSTLENNYYHPNSTSFEKSIISYENFAPALLLEWEKEVNNIESKKDEFKIDFTPLLEKIENNKAERKQEKDSGFSPEKIYDNTIKRHYDVFYLTEKEVERAIKHLRYSGKLNLSQAEQHVTDSQTQGEINEFLIQKKLEENCVSVLEMSKGQKFEKCLFFDDGSIATYKDNSYHAPNFKGAEYKEFAYSIANNYIDYKFRKKPKYASVFKEAFKKSTKCFKHFDEVADALFENEQKIKSVDDNPCESIKNIIEKENNKDDLMNNFYEANLFEKILDYLDCKVQEHEINKLSKSIVSQKYRDFLTEQNMEYFKLFYEESISKQQIEKHVGSKMASFKTPDDLNKALIRFYNSLSEFDIDSYLDKAKFVNATNVLQNQDLLILKINSYEASEKLGASAWCISRYESYFDDYTEGNKEQFFIYDFSKTPSNEDSMIGITIKNKNEVCAMHYKNDDPVSDETVQKQWLKTIQESLDLEPKQKNNKKPQRCRYQL